MNAQKKTKNHKGHLLVEMSGGKAGHLWRNGEACPRLLHPPGR